MGGGARASGRGREGRTVSGTLVLLASTRLLSMQMHESNKLLDTVAGNSRHDRFHVRSKFKRVTDRTDLPPEGRRWTRIFPRFSGRLWEAGRGERELLLGRIINFGGGEAR